MDVVQRLLGQPLARQHVGDPGRVGGQRLGGDPARGVGHRHRLLRAQERVTGRHGQLAPRRRRRELLQPAVAAAAQRAHHLAERGHQPAALGHRVLGHAEHAHDHVLARQLGEHLVALAQRARQLVAAGAGAAHVDGQPQRVVGEHPRGADDALVQHVEALDLADRGADLGQRLHGLPQQLLAARGRQPPGGVQGGEQQRVGAGGLAERDRAVHHAGVDPPAGAQVHHGRLGQRADDLVGAGDDHVGAQRQRGRGQLGVEGQVRAPGLVDHQRHAVRVRHLGQRGHVGHRAEVRGRDGGGAHRVGRLGERPVQRLRAPGSARCRGRGRPRARRSAASARPGCSRRPCWSARCAARPRRSPAWASASSATWLACEAPLPRNQVRSAPQASAASRWASWNGVGSGGPTSMPGVSAGMSSASAFSPMASRSSGSAAAPPLWPGTYSRSGSSAAWALRASRYGARDWSLTRPRSSRPRRRAGTGAARPAGRRRACRCRGRPWPPARPGWRT